MNVRGEVSLEAQTADSQQSDLTVGERQLLRASFRNGIGWRPSGDEFEHHASLIADKLRGTSHNVVL